ncbi:MAG: hypothetical protein JW770_06815 [Actinobacteria bacterium]|nr:hypothetical protein [Actinomycetota bacterium]
MNSGDLFQPEIEPPEEGPSGAGNIILAIRVTLIRNLLNHCFPAFSKLREKYAVLNIIREAFDRSKILRGYQCFDLSSIKREQRDLFFADYLIDPEAGKKTKGRALLLHPKTGIYKKANSVIINHEDHLKIQCAMEGINISGAYEEVLAVERELEPGLEFAFDRELGYLTADPANLGTALGISLMVHLPALAISPGVSEFINNLNNIGCSIRGYYSESQEVTGNLFLVNSLKSLGRSEEEIVEEMHAICLNILEDEQNARKKLEQNDLLGIKDNIYRSFGLLKYARILSYEEAFELLSLIRLGLDTGIIGSVNGFNFYRLINMISDARIISDYEMSDNIDEDVIDMKRAGIIREKILKKGTDLDV